MSGDCLNTASAHLNESVYYATFFLAALVCGARGMEKRACRRQTAGFHESVLPLEYVTLLSIRRRWQLSRDGGRKKNIQAIGGVL
jgi:hypothetical protein